MMKETELAQPVAKLLENMGYEIYSEIPLGFGGFRIIDIIGINEDNVIAIELKLSLTEQVFYQAIHCKLVAQKVFIAVSTNPMQKSIEKCKKHGIGIITVKDDKAVTILESEINDIAINRVTNIKDKLKYISKGVYAGKPNEKGKGPAQDCLKRIKEYLKTHQNVSWKELFKNVHNHYSGYKSMQNAMINRFNFRIKKYKNDEQVQLKLEL